MSAESGNYVVAKTATEALNMLWRKGFFRKWQTMPSVAAHLAELEHNFGGPELGMALNRTKLLTRRGKKGHYEYIQKYPFVPQEQVARSR